MMRPSVATIFLTRRCSVKCWHCRIWKRNCEEKDVEYWIELSKELKRKWDIHVNFYGGEPLEYKNSFDEFVKLVRGLSENEINYSFNSSSIGLSNKKAKILVNAGLTNWTSSVDSLYDERSLQGIRALELFRKIGVPDLMAEMVLYPLSVKNFIEAVDYLSKEGYWVSITFYSWAKAKWYDSFPKRVIDWSKDDIMMIEGLKDLVIRWNKEGRKIHGFHKKYLSTWTKEMLDQTYKCKNIASFHPDCDGTMRLCRDIVGEKVRKWDSFDAIDSWHDFTLDWKEDYEKYCLGCNWACVVWAPLLKEEIKHEAIK